MSGHAGYPAYQECTVGCIDKLPVDWRVKAVRYILKDGAEGIKIGPFGSALKLEDMVEDGVRVFGQENVIKNDFDLGKRRIKKSKYEEMQVYRVFAKDLLMTMMGTSGKCRMVPPHAEPGIIDSHLLRLRVKTEHISSEYFQLLIDESAEIDQQIRQAGKGSIMHGLNSSIVKSILLPVPSKYEQGKILDFLDHETAKIDTLIEKQQQLIKLLKEKRQAVISHAVTKGLNPDAPMKDSGVEWLGEVPAHWDVKRLKQIAVLQSGIPKGNDMSGKQRVSVPMLRVANVQDGYLNLSDVHVIDIEPEQLDRYSLKLGDLLMNEGGDNDKLGRGAVWRGSIHPCIHQNHVFAIRPLDTQPEWLAAVTRSEYAKYHFYRVAKQSTNLASISSSNIKETPIVLPPVDERSMIIDFIGNEEQSFSLLERKCLTQIELLKERRTALISAAVTGKIDVRNWQPPESSSTSSTNA